jgi:hypothetical protein
LPSAQYQRKVGVILAICPILIVEALRQLEKQEMEIAFWDMSQTANLTEFYKFYGVKVESCNIFQFLSILINDSFK